MKFKDIQKLSDIKFRRLTGVSWATFNLMLAELNKELPCHIGKGRPHKLPLEDRLLLCIEGEFKHEVRQFQKPYDNQQAEQISLMV